MRFYLIVCFLSLNVFAGADLLLTTQGESQLIKTTSQVTKTLKLDDPFLVQFYSKWKSHTNLSIETNNWAKMVVEHNFLKAAHLISVVQDKTNESFINTVNATSVYLYWKLGLYSTFVDSWINLAINSNFINSELGIALDQIVGKDNFHWVIENGLILNQDQLFKISKIESDLSETLIILKALGALRSGDKAVELLSKVKNHAIRFQLAQTIVADLSKKGKLSDAARILKLIHEPKIGQSENIDEISSYYLLLARLLYQAKALEEASNYYEMIPESSKFYLQARVENLWILLRQNNISKLKGELESLSLDIFEDQYLPEVYLVGSISQLKLCQFQDVKNSFDQFILKNKNWLKLINKNIASEKPEVINKDDFNYQLTQKAINTNTIEIKKIKKLATESINALVPAIGVQRHWSRKLAFLNQNSNILDKKQTIELRRKWVNRKKILDSTIRKMRFVKIEFISLMRRFTRKIASNTDSISTYNSAPKRSNEIDFPFDGVIWGDEIFELTANVKSLCLRGM